ncbi:MAG: hypothetical protein GY769_01775 [bacterium]|nr:hypothetical protein [bacterium]
MLSYYPKTIEIDGEEIPFRIKRQAMEENVDFINRLTEVGTPTAARFFFREAGPEQERDEEGKHKIGFAEIVAKKLNAFTPEGRAKYEAAKAEDTEKAKAFFIYAFEKFVTVESGLIEVLPDGTEKSVTDGIDVLRLFGAREDVLSKILEAIRVENTLGAEQKKILQSGIVSSRTSSEPGPDRPGPKQETIAASVKSSDTEGAEVA